MYTNLLQTLKKKRKKTKKQTHLQGYYKTLEKEEVNSHLSSKKLHKKPPNDDNLKKS